MPDTVQNFEINDNKITSLDPRTFDPFRASLRVFNAQNNEMSSLDLGDMPNLSRLDLSNNQLGPDPPNLSGAPSLREIRLYDNPLRRRPDLTSHHKLKMLHFDMCDPYPVGCSYKSLGCMAGSYYVSCKERGLHGEFYIHDLPKGLSTLYFQDNLPSPETSRV